MKEAYDKYIVCYFFYFYFFITGKQYKDLFLANDPPES